MNTYLMRRKDGSLIGLGKTIKIDRIRVFGHLDGKTNKYVISNKTELKGVSNVLLICVLRSSTKARIIAIFMLIALSE